LAEDVAFHHAEDALKLAEAVELVRGLEDWDDHWYTSIV